MALAGVTPRPDEPVTTLKVHCVVGCPCQALKDRGGIDHRPLYLGLWDGQVIVDDRMRLSYHAPGIDHGFYLHWAGRLFGLQETRWHEDAAPGARNLDRLHALLADWRPGRYVMPMVDMALLPQRDNKFAQASFPHYAPAGAHGGPRHLADARPGFPVGGAAARPRPAGGIPGTHRGRGLRLRQCGRASRGRRDHRRNAPRHLRRAGPCR